MAYFYKQLSTLRLYTALMLVLALGTPRCGTAADGQNPYAQWVHLELLGKFSGNDTMVSTKWKANVRMFFNRHGKLRKYRDRHEAEISLYKPTKRGERQGFRVLSPGFFNITSEMVLRNTQALSGLIVSRNIYNLRYAADTELTAESETELQNILDKVTETSQKKGLDLNTKRRKCMVAT
ncbi:retrovirus-related pol polyprotein from type-2 retrotransposable element r2dm [Plakobranchus ocellatus]|uniref:Retrovirus-related pol polyprotein from type-2 retrotransposable element r2dm n=1 Tax=Plakobranchus ocellatus TaxID=259542 RepID=A0AAV3Y4Y1_9GAST|nr:retrovirus-related pol polyprotein from type-2 retrotransposable element r2dm [Plakobranchus ocellatus]